MRFPVFAALSVALFPAAGVVSAAAAEAPFTITDSISAPGVAWSAATFDSERHRLFVGRPDGVTMVESETRFVVPTFVTGHGVGDVLVLSDSLAISTNEETNRATLFGVNDGHVVLDLPAGTKPGALARDPKTGLVAVVNAEDGKITLIDIDAKVRVGAIAVGGKLGGTVADGRGRLFVTIVDRNQVAQVDVGERSVLARQKLPGCEGPQAVGLNQGRHVLLIACANHVAIALSTEDGQVLGTPAIGDGPGAVLVDTKGGRFLIPSGRDGVLTILDVKREGKVEVAGTLPTARGVRTGAIDFTTGKVYLPAVDFPPDEPDDTATPKPGSFHILVLSPPKG